ncbi:hypothetical protein CTAYLR_003030 [Chrysophaeum taylorii]|uniref:UBA domain-containing protein n=1 Tax=Chrysophaeum taylorii TaxID=2483200 RepID=A0AAD7XGI3_9STRA|nr:hypothetical protein CTAYLR_003030 [Chrysophaeum taylorii]
MEAVDAFFEAGGGEAATEKARSTLLKILGNLASDPSNEKYRKLRTSNAVIQAKVLSVPGAVGVLEAVGFVRGEESLEVGPDAGDRAAEAVRLLSPLRVSASLQHSSDARGVAFGRGGSVATACLDNVARLFDARGALVREFRGHSAPARSDGGVLAVRVGDDGRLFTGARDGALIVWQADGSSCTRHVGHGEPVEGRPRLTNAQIVSCVSVDCGLVLTGGWDQTCIAWDADGSNPARRYGPFGAAVNGVCCFRENENDDKVVAAAACGDGTLNFFDPRAEPGSVALAADAKGPPMRGVAATRGCLLTVSNDGILRLWEAQRLVRGVRASDDYLFAVAAEGNRAYVGGDDAVVSVFRVPSLTMETRIPTPGAVWSLAARHLDLAVGCEAPFGALVFSRDPAKRADSVVANHVANLCGDAKAKIAKAPRPEVLGDARPKAQSSGGAMTVAGGTSSSSSSFGGTSFDYSFPVDLGRGSNLTIEWNKGDDPNQVAVDFCARHGIPMNQVGDVVNFIHTASGGPAAASSASSSSSSSGPSTAPNPAVQADMVAQVMAMGVDEARARDALEKANWASIEAAINFLF